MNNNFEEKNLETTLDALLDFFSSIPKSTVKLVNPQRYQLMLRVAAKLTELLRSTIPEGEIEINVNEQFNIGSISVELGSLTIDVPRIFSDIINVADNFEIYPLENGNLRLDITFQSVLKTIV